MKNYEPSLPIDNRRQQNAWETRPLPMIARSTEAPALSKSTDESDFDIVAVAQTLRRRRVWIYACTATMLTAAALVCLVMPRQYKAESKLEILKQDMGGFSLNDAPGASGSGDSLDFNMTLQTQLAVLKSDTLARQVIRELNLEETKEFNSDSSLKAAIAKYLPGNSSGQSPEEHAAGVLKNFKAHLTVDSVSGTRLITVGYAHSDPKMAAAIVNQLVTDFVEYNFQVRYDATTKATDWLGRQMVDLKSQVEQTQARAVQLEKDSGIFGEDEHHNVVVTRLEQLSNEVTAAEENRVVKEGVYRLASDGNPEVVAGLVGTNAAVGGTGSGGGSPLPINNLRQREAELSSEYAEAAAKYGSDYPRLIQIKERLSSIRASIQEELDKVVARSKSEYTLAATHEASAKRAFAEQKRIAAQMNDKATDFLIAKHEAEANRVLYEHLLGKLKEAGLLAGLHSSELHVLDRASVPTRPARPNVPLYLAFGALAGVTLGMACAFVAETTDRTIRNPGEIESTTYAPVLGVIPDARLTLGRAPKDRTNVQTRNALLSLDNSPVAEAFRAARTALLLSGVKVFMITSSTAQEGKSFTSLNLALALAHNGHKVLLVDADLRRGTLSRVINQYSGIGLSQILLGKTDRELYRPLPSVPGLNFMPAGAPPPCPSELLGSPKMVAMIESWRQQFDFVLFDTPPLLPVTDAAVLTPNVDAVIVVVRFGVTNRQSVIRTIRVLRDVRAKRLGVLVNAMDVHSQDYYHYSGSYGYEEYHASTKTSPKGETA